MEEGVAKGLGCGHKPVEMPHSLKRAPKQTLMIEPDVEKGKDVVSQWQPVAASSPAYNSEI
jgi:hypothetical protein